MSKAMTVLAFALCPLIFLSGCNEATQLDQALSENGEKIGKISVQALPAYPDDCRVILTSNFSIGERLDVVVLRLGNNLTNQNNRLARCADFYDEIRNGVN